MKQKLLRLLSMLSIMVLYCSTAGAQDPIILVEFSLTDGDGYSNSNPAIFENATIDFSKSGKFETKNSCYGAKIDNDSKYVKVEMKSPLQLGDVIYITEFSSANPSADRPFGIKIEDENNNEVCVLSRANSAGKALETVNYTVDASSPLLSKTIFLIKKSTANSIYFHGLKVTTLYGDQEMAAAISVAEAERNLTTEINTPTTLRATATGNPTPTLQWYQCDNAEKTNPVAIEGATNATYDFTPTATGTYYFYCVAKNTLTEGGEQTASSEVITVNAVDKLPSSDTSIGSISVGEINLAVSSSTIDYTAYVLNVGDNISVTVTPADENASVVDGNTFMVTSGEKKEFKIKAEDGTEKTYSITATNINDETTSNNYYYVQKKDYLAGQKIIARDITAQISPTASNVGAKMNTDDSKTSTLNNKFAVHISGSVNPSNNSSTGVPTNGAYFSFTPTKSGKLNVAIFLNAEKELWVSNGTNRMVAGTDFTSEFASNQELTNNKITAATYGNLFFAVEANTTYYVYCTGSKVMFGGFIFTPSNQTIGISASHGYTSYCSEYALDFTDVTALEAYVASAAAKGVVSMKNVQKVPANTGLVLKSTSGAAVSDVQVPVIESADAVGANLLVGTLAATTVEPSSDTNGYNYLFGTKNDVLGFYKLITNTFEMPANKAYLHTETPASNGAKGVIMDFGNGETTAISNIDADADNNAIYYNLNGQRVVNPGKGLYILNGKKVMVK